MLKRLKRIAVAIIGGTVLAIGLALVVLPGPAIVVIPVGLAILATEFLWARRMLDRVRRDASIFQRKRGETPGDGAPPPGSSGVR